VRRSPRTGAAKLFSREFDDVRPGKHVVVVVVVDADPSGRCWAITAYVTRRLAGGDVEWKRS
jgi:hypothetical protein